MHGISNYIYTNVDYLVRYCAQIGEVRGERGKELNIFSFVLSFLIVYFLL
jgi:hypothetical protein